jgi:threonine aldolase
MASYTREVGDLAHSQGLYVHLDGARIFNAAVAMGVTAAELAAPADSVTFCLSKGLCAPVGSVLCGSTDFIRRTHRVRKQLGGGMRQAGILAAAGIVAMETMVDRLADDHSRAKCLAQGLSSIPELILDPGTPYTNMVFLSLTQGVPYNASQVATRLKEHNVRVGVVGARRFRLVTHYWIDDEAVERAVEAFRKVMI